MHMVMPPIATNGERNAIDAGSPVHATGATPRRPRQSPRLAALRRLAGGLAAGGAMTLLAACNSAGPGADLGNAGALSQPPSSMTASSQFDQGSEARYCPTVTLREGTAILRKTIGEEVDYVASIADTTRDCRIVDGKLLMKIGVLGRVTPGAVAQDRTLRLPIRVAVLRGQDVIYSELGQQSVAITRSGGAQTFTYVDETVLIDPAQTEGIVIFAGFDEGAPE
ncbi:hypothetical protein VQ042_17395 [Aurantimonas sp. A2-1-M11]|uniref:hypothetical protein n=1 Tax=Aurantimonas sp. A2-1-M11 TaxID=3113712 RepID=UPI002F933596